MNKPRLDDPGSWTAEEHLYQLFLFHAAKGLNQTIEACVDFGPPLDGTVRALLPLSNGDVIAAGDFLQAGSQTVNRIARLTNGTWQSFSTGINGSVHALTLLSNSSIVAAGQFSFAGSSNVSNIALWNGRWWPLDSGLGGRVNSLVTMPDGTVIAAGDFTANGVFSQTLNRIARWANNTWQPVGAGFNGPVKALQLKGNRLVATGEFTASGSTPLNRIAEWNGAAWVTFGTGMSGASAPDTPAQSGLAIAVLNSTDILVGLAHSNPLADFPPIHSVGGTPASQTSIAMASPTSSITSTLSPLPVSRPFEY